METRKSKRSVRLALVLSAAVAGTALVGWGGLAAWQAYTQNAGNAFTTGSIGHTNQVSGKTLVCQSTTAESTSCDVIVTAANMGSNWGGATGKVTITSTASLPSTFTLSTPAAPTGPLCSDLTLLVTGADGSQYVDQATGECVDLADYILGLKVPPPIPEQIAPPISAAPAAELAEAA